MANSFSTIIFCSLFLLCSLLPAQAQSRDQNFPTPVRANVVEGSIPARAMGDARNTSYFYTFEGGQGDIFINVVTTNLTGDIDVYTADSLQPLTKIVLYDPGTNETGRLIYLRRPARLILRVQGRTPNDDAASFRIKFGGSFSASRLPDVEEAPTVARTAEKAETDSSTVENNVPGDPEPAAKEKTDEKVKSRSGKDENVDVSADEVKKSAEDDSKVVRAPDVRTVFGNRSTRSRTPGKATVTSDTRPATTPSRNRRTPPDPPSARTNTPDPLANIRLVIETKDGGLIEHPMSEVIRFSVDRGVLTLIVKSGKTNRLSILNVEKVTIQ